MDPGDTRTGHTGGPNHGVLLRLEDWEEGGYLVTDKPNPRGEIIVGGPSIAKGYFKQPPEVNAGFFEEFGHRWFRTGDIGEITPSGCLKIIDRKKDLVKLSHGEYISLGEIECKIMTLPIVESVCIHADSTKDVIVAIVVPSEISLLKMASTMDIGDGTLTQDELC